ncbi:MAG: phosphatidylglycerol lysyltransferase domain-containing protein, partial [Prevotellaceae bacterium]|nr:phosphatidylglycerol lysyltransferase domain-containing protein [Prevotellaceae bacterium]
HSPERDSWDYIYKVDDLSTLQGKRYQSKRNHIARFTELPDWRYEPIGGANITECIEMNSAWCHLMGCTENKSLHMETCAAEMGLQNFDALGLDGALLRLSGKVVAYTLGEPINSDTFIVHVEKAFPDIRGAYPTINREFMRNLGTGFVYVNREDDVGDEGLRRAKESYHPVFMEEKYLLTVSYNDLNRWHSTT